MTSQVLCFKIIEAQQDDEISFEGRLSCSVQIWLAGRRTKFSKYAETQKQQFRGQEDTFRCTAAVQQKQCAVPGPKSQTADTPIRNRWTLPRNGPHATNRKNANPRMHRPCAVFTHLSVLYVYSFASCSNRTYIVGLDCWFYPILAMEHA